MWYGKGPGVDRTGDVFRHANFAGTSKNGGVLALMGDDHTAESSTTAHQSEFHFVDVMIPILNPAGVQEIIDYGLYGWAMSRFCGSWAALKCMHETVESTAVVDGALDRVKIVIPGDDFAMPPGGLNIRLRRRHPRPGSAAARLQARRHARLRPRQQAQPRASSRAGASRRSASSRSARAISTCARRSTSSASTRSSATISASGSTRSRCPWPIVARELTEFAEGLELIIVVEEKRSLIEVQVREELYGTANQPVVIGKRDEKDDWLFPVKGALDPNDIAIAIGERVLRARAQRGDRRAASRG